LLHPHLDDRDAAPWLATPINPMDQSGCVRISQRPGLGMDIDWDFIERHRV
jgi:L-alanine-DL-glutamate epimerase-like enolase superfamily enzyme